MNRYLLTKVISGRTCSSMATLFGVRSLRIHGKVGWCRTILINTRCGIGLLALHIQFLMLKRSRWLAASHEQISVPSMTFRAKVLRFCKAVPVQIKFSDMSETVKHAYRCKERFSTVFPRESFEPWTSLTNDGRVSLGLKAG